MADSNNSSNHSLRPPPSPLANASDYSRRRKKRDKLASYYGTTTSRDDSGSTSSPAGTPPVRTPPPKDEQQQQQRHVDVDINSSPFNADKYFKQLISRQRLPELITHNSELSAQVRSIDSDLQTLVYENYSRFLSATDTIRKMKSKVEGMSGEMDQLAKNMAAITACSDHINSTLNPKRERITQLTSVHMLLKKLQFLFELPARLQQCVTMGSYSQAVSYFKSAIGVLEKYQGLPSFEGIQKDCQAIIKSLTVTLWTQLKANEKSTESSRLLLELGESREMVCEHILRNGRKRLDACDITQTEGEDTVDYISRMNNTYLCDISELVISFVDLFFRHESDSTHVMEGKFVYDDADGNRNRDALIAFLQHNIGHFSDLVRQKLKQRPNHKALDDVYTAIIRVSKLCPFTRISDIAESLVRDITIAATVGFAEDVDARFTENISGLRVKLLDQECDPLGGEVGSMVSEQLDTISKSVLTELLCIIDEKLPCFSLSSLRYVTEMPSFLDHFYIECVRVRFVEHVINKIKERALAENGNATIVLLLSRFCQDLPISSIFKHVADIFPPPSTSNSAVKSLRSVSDIQNDASVTAQALLRRYITIQGNHMANMIRKSVETRDWLTAVEPRSVRPVVRRLVEALAVLEPDVEALFPSYDRDHSSQRSSQQQHSLHNGRFSVNQQRHLPAPTRRTGGGGRLMSNIQKLFSERIEIFDKTVSFAHNAIMTCIVKICLKAFVETVRLRTFDTHGLQQIQVDAQYLNTHLWQFAIEESVLATLLGEVVSSSMGRCVGRILYMENSVVDAICDKS